MPYWAARVKKQVGKKGGVDAFNGVLGMAQATRWVSPLHDFFFTPADPSKLYWMCPPYHRFSDCVWKIRQERLRAIVLGPKWTHRGWLIPLMEITLQGYHLPGPETKACLHQNDHLTPLPQRGWSKVALYVDAGMAEENLAATECHVASVLAPAVPNPYEDNEPGMTSEEVSEDERVLNHLASVRTLTYQAGHKKLLAPVTDAFPWGAWPRDAAADTHKQAGRQGTALTGVSSCSGHVTKRFRILATLKQGNKSMYSNTSGYVHMGLRLDWGKGILGQ